MKKDLNRKDYKMKALKTSIIALFFLIILVAGSTADAGPRVRVYIGAPKIGAALVKPGPNYVWVEGHYKLNVFGKWVWVPGHWKRT